ncbi:unnamed protein product [Effrenium voratum]|nr:unnamed protein product [Effrenium voratum]
MTVHAIRYIWPREQSICTLPARPRLRGKPMGNFCNKLVGNKYTENRTKPIADAVNQRYSSSPEVRADLICGGAIALSWCCRIEVRTSTEERFNQLKEEILQVIWEMPMVKRECASPDDIDGPFAVRFMSLSDEPSDQ